MPDYLFRLIDSGGMNVANHPQACCDDYEAMALARNLIEGGGLAHIWAGDRNVGQIFMPLATPHHVPIVLSQHRRSENPPPP